MKFMKTKIIISYLILISLISLGFKLYLADFSIPVNSDNLSYVLNGVAHTNGDFTHPPQRAMGWSIFLSLFFNFLNSENFIDYSNLAKIVSIGISTSTIFLIYSVGRKFFDQRYALTVSYLFAFLPALNHNSGLALSEPIFILVTLASFYFLLHEKSKFIIISLVLAGLAYWIRLNGVVIFIIISLTYLLTFKKSQNFVRNYGIGIVLFIIVISPMLIQKNDLYGDPFYSSYQGTLFSKNYEDLISRTMGDETKTSASEFIENEGIFSFIDNFIIKGIINSLSILSKLSFPYLFILIPFGIIFSFRAFDQNSKYVKRNWIFILSSFFSMCLIVATVPEKRFLFFILPSLILFSVIPMQRVIEYGLSTFSFSRKQKDIFLICVLIIVIILSGLFTLRYEQADPILENEKIDFARYALENLNGNALRDFGGITDYLTDVVLLEYNHFKDFEMNYWIDKEERKKFNFRTISIHADNIDELITKGEKLDLKYLISNNENTSFYPYVDQIYYNEENYPFLIKIFDSDDYGFEKLKIKIFEIDYKKFHESRN
tara:strand:- start:4564 stop:6201 length:1638 start_codon:yes stop_codon:yes gene_type:complete